ncbi:MAG: 1-acyl-sn-glycerol-3-phosphate acyltransferase [Bacteroidetes bacterium]|nr:1-acyl-sn-glycerol-3-phosphate acyltransferase [Bacteroidota bacterium]
MFARRIDLSMLKNILRHLLGIFALLIFALSLIIASIAYVLVFLIASEKKAPHIAHVYISRTWASFLFPAFGIRVKVLHQERINPESTYVFVANHRSLLDVPAYAVACTNTFRFLAKEELTKIPLLGFIIRKLYISVNRKNKAARVKSMENMLKSIQEDISVFLCPEGTRNKGDQPLLPFHDGAFRLAIAAQVPLAVMTIKNSDQLLSPNNPLALSPGTLECIWSEPIPTTGMTEDDIPRLREMARSEMIRHWTS